LVLRYQSGRTEGRRAAVGFVTIRSAASFAPEFFEAIPITTLACFTALSPPLLPLCDLPPPGETDLVERFHLFLPTGLLLIWGLRKLHHDIHPVSLTLPSYDLFSGLWNQ
jgi:hypothetical protein